jgi:hypothetical protein
MADSFTANLNLRKPEVGAAYDTWGGTAGLNSDMDLLDAVFLATGLGTKVGLHIGSTDVLNVEGTALFADSTDTTKAMTLDSSLITTGTLRTLQAPDVSGVIATQAYVRQFTPTGTVYSGYFPVVPPGFVMADGRTIGDATSGAVNRANADTQNLFQQLWLRVGNAQCPVLPGGRGASAAADWAAHKTLALPNHSGRALFGRDDLSGTNQGILSPSGIASTTIGAVGGNATESALVTVTGSRFTDADNADVTVQAGSGINVANAGHAHATNTITSTGATNAVTNAPPAIMVDVIIAL